MGQRLMRLGETRAELGYSAQCARSRSSGFPASGGAVTAGAGRYGVGGRYFHAPFVAAADDVELVGVVTRSPQRRAELATDHPGVPMFHNRRWDADIRTLAAVRRRGQVGQLWRIESRFDLDELITSWIYPRGAPTVASQT